MQFEYGRPDWEPGASGLLRRSMLDLCKLIFGTVIDLLRSRATLEAEILVLRQQINVLRRASPKRRPFGAIDRLILRGVCRLFPRVMMHLP